MRFVVQEFRAMPVYLAPELSFHQVDAPERIYQFYRDVVEKDRGYEPEKEHVVVLALNSRLRPLGWHLVSTGGISEAPCHPREVLRPLIVRGAHSSSFATIIHQETQADPTRHEP